MNRKRGLREDELLRILDEGLSDVEYLSDDQDDGWEYESSPGKFLFGL